MKAETAAQQTCRLFKTKALPLGRTANNNQNRPSVPGGGGLLAEAPRFAGILGHQIFRRHGPQEGGVHFPGKGTLHGDDPVRPQPRRPAGGQGRLHRQDPGADPPGESRQGGVFRQLLAAGGEEDVPLRPRQPVHGSLRVREVHRSLRQGVRLPEQTQVLHSRPAAGLGDVLRHLRRVGVGGVHHQIEALPDQQGLHLLLCQAAVGNRQAVSGRQQRLPVLRGDTGGYLHRRVRQQLHQPAALRGPGEDAQLIHPDTPGASPAPRQ